MLKVKMMSATEKRTMTAIQIMGIAGELLLDESELDNGVENVDWSVSELVGVAELDMIRVERVVALDEACEYAELEVVAIVRLMLFMEKHLLSWI